MSTLDSVTSERVADWAMGVVEEWLPGYVHTPDSSREEFRIVQLEGDDPAVPLFAVETVDRLERVVFQLRITAERVTDG